jgi:hypothetical protein
MQSALAGLSLLVLGDSHWATQGYLITTLQDQLIRQGATVNSFAACGASPSIWVFVRLAPCGAAQRLQRGAVQTRTGAAARSIPLDQLVRQYRPTMIAVSMADTIAGYVERQAPALYIREEVRTLTDFIKELGLPCIWIGPAWGTEGGPFLKSFARVQEVNAILAQSVSPCTYVDSTKLSRPGEWPTFDGQHFTLEGYRAYGTALAQRIVQMPEVKAATQRR